MDLTPIIARLRTLPELRAVGFCADVQAAMDATIALPAAYVQPLAESAGPLELIGVTSQRVAVRFGVVLAVSGKRDAMGSAAEDFLHPLRMSLRAALVGFVPDAETGEPVRYTEGQIITLDNARRLWWLDQFEVFEHFRN